MAETRIDVDPLNPGQVFACLGLLEATQILLGEAQGVFDWREPGRTLFLLEAPGEVNPLQAVLTFLRQAEVLACLPQGSPHGKKPPKAKSDKQVIPFHEVPLGMPFPSPDEGADKLPAILQADGKRICIDYWSDPTSMTGRDNVKFWAGAGGYPGVALLKDALNLLTDRWDEAATDPFGVAAPQSSSFRLDWRRDYVPLDAGFSLNQHSHIVTLGYPLVEILGAIGLTHARPRVQPGNKLAYTYGLIGRQDDRTTYPPLFLRAALGCVDLPFPMRVFHMKLDWPGQEGQARCITNVYEEN